MSDDTKKLPLRGHLAELRKRLIRGVIAIAITTAVSFIFAPQIFEVLKAPAGEFNPIFTEMTEMIGTYMKLALASGIILAMPYLTYELVMFVSPALTHREKRYVNLILPWVALMFIGGVVFGYFILMPPATGFLINFGSDIATPQIRISSYVSVMSRLLLAIGLVFELPVLTTFLARLGILEPRWLASKRKIAIIFAFVLAAIVTPTLDPVNQSLVAIPLIVLYEMSIWLARLVHKKRSEPSPAPTPAAQ